MGQTVQLGYGKANLATLATYSAMKVEAPFSRSSAVTSGKRMGSASHTQIGAHELEGGVTVVPTEHENGTVILLQVKWMRGGVGVSEGGLFMRLRSGAPLYNISGRIPTEAGNMAGDTFTMFNGYADILNPAELQLLGIEVNRGYISRYMDEEELEECFKIVQLREETQARPSITAIATPTGVQMREVQPAPKRRIVLRK